MNRREAGYLLRTEGFNDQQGAEQTFQQIEDAGYPMPHPESTREGALHHIQRESLSLEIGHQRLDAELHEQRDDKHRRDDAEPQFAQRRITRHDHAIQQQIRTANDADVPQLLEHLAGKHARELFVRLSVEQGGDGKIADSPQSADPDGSRQCGKVVRNVFQGTHPVVRRHDCQAGRANEQLFDYKFFDSKYHPIAGRISE